MIDHRNLASLFQCIYSNINGGVLGIVVEAFYRHEVTGLTFVLKIKWGTLFFGCTWSFYTNGSLGLDDAQHERIRWRRREKSVYN